LLGDGVLAVRRDPEPAAAQGLRARAAPSTHPGRRLTGPATSSGSRQGGSETADTPLAQAQRAGAAAAPIPSSIRSIWYGKNGFDDRRISASSPSTSAPRSPRTPIEPRRTPKS